MNTGIRLAGSTVEATEPWPVAVVSPATGETLASVRGGGAADAARAVDAAAKPLPEWSRSARGHRAAVLREVATELRRETVTDELATLTSRETGKRVAESRAEVGLSAAFFEWFADAIMTRHAEGWGVAPGHRHDVGLCPLGVVAVLTPWNFPLSIPARKIAPALAAGCTAVFKPSEVAPLSGLRLAEIVDRHVPAGVLNTVVGEPRATTTTWLDHPDVRGLTFTGSTRVGREIAAHAGRTLTRTVLELGGNAPFVVLDDADPEAAAEQLMTAKYRNNGQSCIAANQAWVPRSMLEPVSEAFLAASDRLVLSDPLDAATTLGPLALPGDPARVDALVDACGTVRRAAVSVPDTGHFARPAVCVDPPPDADMVTGEVFGPAVSIRPYDTLEEVVGATRSGAHGLGGYVAGTDTARAVAVAESLDVGIVGVNTATPNTPQVPFAGRGDSGWGTEGGQAGLDAFLVPQTVAVASPAG